MSTAPLTPFDDLFAKLTQAMSAEGSPPIRHEVGTQASSVFTADERVIWVMGPAGTGIETVVRPFQLPDCASPNDQAWDWRVEIHGPSLLRVGEIHSLLVGWTDLLIGPEQGAAPSADATPAEAVGTVDLATLSYPTSDLDGLALTFTLPYPLTVTMPAGPLDSPIALAVAVGQALRASGIGVLVALDRGDTTERYLRLTMPADPLTDIAPTFALDPAAADSACAVLGFDDTPAIGSAPTMPYRPGYKIGKSEGAKGGTVDAGAWGLVVPVRLFQPVKALVFPPAIIQRVQLLTSAATSTGENIATETPVPFP